MQLPTSSFWQGVGRLCYFNRRLNDAERERGQRIKHIWVIIVPCNKLVDDTIELARGEEIYFSNIVFNEAFSGTRFCQSLTQLKAMIIEYQYLSIGRRPMGRQLCMIRVPNFRFERSVNRGNIRGLEAKAE